MLMDGGEVLSSDGVGDHGGRAVVEDEHDVSGHHSPGRGRFRVHGDPGGLGVEGIGGWEAREREVFWRQSGGGELVAGD